MVQSLLVSPLAERNGDGVDRLAQEGEPPVCPTCKRAFVLPEEAQKSVYPFCSERCRTIDLARWLDGKYQIPVVDDDESEPEGEVGGK